MEDHDEEENLFHQDDSDDDTPPHPQGVARKNHRDRRGEHEDRVRFNPKVEIPDFEGKNQPEEFVNWFNTVERIFEYGDAPENRKVKLVAIKLKKHASLWWENLIRQREQEGRSKIVTWDKMKRELKRKYLPDNYRQDIFLKIHNFRQKEMTVAEYTAEFDHLMLKGELTEPEKQTIVRYLGGLMYEISNVVQLQPYWIFNDVCKLALKVEKQLKENRGGTNRFSPNSNGAYSKSSGFKSTTTPKDTPKEQTKKEGKQPINASTSSGRRCFKCQGIRHIASECPNKRVVSLMEEEEAEGVQKNSEDEEVVYTNQGLSIVVQ